MSRARCKIPGCPRYHVHAGRCAFHRGLERERAFEAARLSPAPRRCPCGNRIGALNQTGVCPPCRIHRARHGVAVTGVAVAGFTPVCPACGAPAVEGEGGKCEAHAALVRSDLVAAEAVEMEMARADTA